MPLDCLHMTVLEVAHSRTEAEIAVMVEKMEERIPEIVNFTYDHRARLVRPTLSYDAAAIALSFLPAAGEGVPENEASKDVYTYHHLRRDIFTLCNSTGVEVASRYVVPSSHLTIARFVTQKDFSKEKAKALDSDKVASLVGRLDGLNAHLKAQYWSKETEAWTIGEDTGLVCRKGTLWYGRGQTQCTGQGFDV